MKTEPIYPAHIDFTLACAPFSPQYAQAYPSQATALQRAEQIYLSASQLPQRWATSRRFVILETGFGLGNNFLATWNAWRNDPNRCDRLCFISIEKHPPSRADLARAHGFSAVRQLANLLQNAWPPLTPNLHTLEFENGCVQLLLAFGDVRHYLREIVADVDAFFLDGFKPDRNPQMWDAYTLKALARLAKPQASLATWVDDAAVQEHLQRCGFNLNPKGLTQGTTASYAPRFFADKPVGRRAVAPQAREAIVLGAGLAGCAGAKALAQQGVEVRIWDQGAGPCTHASGNPGGIFHGTLNPADGPHARFNRAAALHLQARLADLSLPWLQRGLLRFETTRTHRQMCELVQKLQLPTEYVQVLDNLQAGALAQIDSTVPAWYYPGAGALCPADLARQWLAQSGAKTFWSQTIHALRYVDSQWELLDCRGRVLDRAALLVVASGVASQSFLASKHWPLTVQRGQVTHLTKNVPGIQVPRLPLVGGGYVLADGAGGVWCGATAINDDLDTKLRLQDHQHNLVQAARLTGSVVTTDPMQLHGRVGHRLIANDRLPLIGAVNRWPTGTAARDDQARFIEREPGLMVFTALASRGITWSSLGAQTLAALATGAPCPLEASLLDAVDPARFAAKNARPLGQTANRG
mgnify:CR=1 FL=1